MDISRPEWEREDALESKGHGQKKMGTTERAVHAGNSTELVWLEQGFSASALRTFG